MNKMFSIIKVFFLTGVILLSSCDNVAHEDEIVQETPATSTLIKDLMADVSLIEVGLDQSIIFTDNSIGVKSRTWYIPGAETQTSSAAQVVTFWKKTGIPSVDDSLLGLKICKLTILFRNGDIETKEFPVTVVGFGNKWTPQIQGFEKEDSYAYWQTWNGALASVWPAGTLTTFDDDDGSGNIRRCGKIIYNGEGNNNYWGIITRNSKNYNAIVEAGKTYEFSFWIRADQDGTVQAVEVLNTTLYLPADTLKEGEPIQEQTSLGGFYSLPVTTQWIQHKKDITVSFVGKYGYESGQGINTFPHVQFNGPTPNVFYVDGFELREKE